jgi:hypothetical protein
MRNSLLHVGNDTRRHLTCHQVERGQGLALGSRWDGCLHRRYFMGRWVSDAVVGGCGLSEQH